MLCENNGTQDEREHNLKCLAVKQLPVPEKKVFLLFSEPCAPTPLPISPLYQGVIFRDSRLSASSKVLASDW